ncbi:MAG TPA: hypothetical protein VK638_50525 [Edaphobacter sp.]|nr:hypothetical protein [Edaphobacter sp.]
MKNNDVTQKMHPYDYAERLMRVMSGTYDELMRAVDEEQYDSPDVLDLLDTLLDTLGTDITDETRWEWSISKTGEIYFDVPARITLEQRQRRLARNKEIHSVLKKIGTPDAVNLIHALKQVSKGPRLVWGFEVTPSGVIILHRDAASVRESTVTVKILYRAYNEEIIVKQAPIATDGHVRTTIHQAILRYFDASIDRTILERAGLVAIETSINGSRAVDVDEETSDLIDAFPPQAPTVPLVQ